MSPSSGAVRCCGWLVMVTSHTDCGGGVAVVNVVLARIVQQGLDRFVAGLFHDGRRFMPGTDYSQLVDQPVRLVATCFECVEAFEVPSATGKRVGLLSRYTATASLTPLVFVMPSVRSYGKAAATKF